eukprot:Lankesteria_metandrocarpae@DN4620_c0_g1_i2.p1
MTSYAQVFGGHEWGLRPQLWVSTESGSKLLFNSGEGTQRFCVENRLKLGKVDDILLTEVSVEALGGLFGLLLTVDTGLSSDQLTNNDVASERPSKVTGGKLCYPLDDLAECERCWFGNRNGKQIRIWGTPPLFKVFEAAVSQRFVDLRHTCAILCQFKEAVEGLQLCSRLSLPSVSSSGESRNISQRRELKLFCLTISTSISDEQHRAEGKHIEPVVLKLDEGQPAESVHPHLVEKRSGESPLCRAPDRKRRHTLSVSDQLEAEDVLASENDGKKKHTMIYFGLFPSTQGQFKPQKAMALKVPRGPLFGKLKEGEVVTLDDGTEILPEDVCDPGVGPQVFAVINLSNDSDLLDKAIRTVESLWSNESGTREERIVSAFGKDAQLTHVYHISPGSTGIYANTKYLRLCKLLGDSTEHVRCDRSLTTSVMPSARGLHNLLRELAPQCFPRLSVYRPTTTPNAAESDEGQSAVFRKYSHMTKFYSMPLSKRKTPESPPESGSDKIFITDKHRIEVDNCRAYFSSVDEKCTHNSSGISVTYSFLGTGSMMPSKYRNVSSFIVQASPSPPASARSSAEAVAGSCSTRMLTAMFDCGEGTVGQLLSLAAGEYEEFKKSICGVDAIFISHRHADHHLGIMRLLALRHKLSPKDDSNAATVLPLVIAPAPMRHWLRFWNNTVEAIPHRFLSCEALNYKNTTKCHITHPTNELAQKQSFSMKFAVCKVDHLWSGRFTHRTLALSHSQQLPTDASSDCEAFGCRLDFEYFPHAQADAVDVCTGHSLAYSGDTRPCDSLVDLAESVDVLIHEATFDDGMEEEAVSRKHSTVGEAVDIGRRSNCKNLILTHFSQRYPKVPIISNAKDKELATSSEDTATSDDPSVLFAFDLMRVNYSLMGSCLSTAFSKLQPILACMDTAPAPTTLEV